MKTQDKPPTEPVSALTYREDPLSVPEPENTETLIKAARGLDLGALLEFSIGVLLILATALAAIPALLVAAAHPLGVPLVAGGVSIAFLAGAVFGDRIND
jgi:hypothetical protein